MESTCPRCNAPLGERQAASNVVMGMNVKGCSSCGGFLIDYSDAEETIGKAMAVPETSGPALLHPEAHEVLKGKCPCCGGAFLPSPLDFELSHHTVYLDQCSTCQGIWFDKGELAEIFDYATQEAVAMGSLDEEKENFSSAPTSMYCPRCASEKEFGAIEILGIKVQKCSCCKGIWLDHGEVESLIGEVSKETGAEDRGFALDAQDTPASGGCPQCRIPLVRWTNLPENLDDLYVEYCPRCSGVWFDKGEFKAILRLFSASPYSTS